jgi:hypothetical protein
MTSDINEKVELLRNHLAHHGDSHATLQGFVEVFLSLITKITTILIKLAISGRNKK